MLYNYELPLNPPEPEPEAPHSDDLIKEVLHRDDKTPLEILEMLQEHYHDYDNVEAWRNGLLNMITLELLES